MCVRTLPDTERTQMTKKRLTDTLVKRLPVDPKKHVQHRDTETKGLAAQVTKAGAKSFVLNYTVNGRERRMTIGAFPEWSVSAAREEAKHLRRKIDQGEDPLAHRNEERTATTVNDLWLEYSMTHLPHLSDKNVADQSRAWKTHVLPKIGKSRLKDLSPRQLDELHREITKSGAVLANRTLSYLRKALNLALRNQWIDRNPADGFRKNPENERQRFLSDAERDRLVAALTKMPNQQAANAIRLLLLTGSRRTEVFEAEWAEFDLTHGVWNKPAARVKTRRDNRIPLSGAAVNLLNSIKVKSSSCYLFPSQKGSPIKDIKAPWRWLLKEAELKDFRIHDLRHSFASLLVSDGETLESIGRLLGHTQAQTTMRYAHLMDDPLRKAVEKAAAKINP
jgi:integrase